MRFLTLLFCLLFSVNAYAGSTYNALTGDFDECITVEEEDGSPSMLSCQKLKVTNGTLVDNGDGTFSLTTGGGGGSSGYATIQEEGTSLTQETVLNFIGSSITCADDGTNSRTNCTVTDSDTTYSAGGTLLDLTGTTFSVNEGTLTDGKGCKYVLGTGLVCDQSYLTSYTETDPIFSAMDTEAELESQLTDVTNVYTNNDGTLADDDLSDNSISDLSDVSVTTPADGQLLKYNGTSTNWENWTPNYLTSESDPQVDAVTSGNFCKGTGTAVSCTDSNTYLTSESDPQVGTLTASKWCVANAGATAIDCTTNAPVTSESDPIVGAVNGIVKADGAGNISQAVADTDYDSSTTNEIQNIFQNITDGTNTATADSSTDTFTLTAGTGISISVNTTTDTATITNTGDTNASDDITTGGRSLTITGQTIDADAELYTDTKCIYIEDPTATDDLTSIWWTYLPVTITKIWCESDQTVNMDLQIDDGTPADVNGTDIACTSTPTTDSSLAGDTTMAQGDRLDLAITSVSGTPTWVSICWEYQRDD